MPPPSPTHYLVIQIPLIYPEGEAPDPQIVAHGQNALADVQRRAGIAKYLTGGNYQITVETA